MPSQMTAVTSIDLDDPEHARGLLTLLDAYARDPMGGGRELPEQVKQQLIPQLRRVPGYLGALAWTDGRTTGLINCFLGFSTFAARPLLNVHDIVVHPEHRSRGVARVLLDWAEQQARERLCCKLTLEVLTNNARALAVYSRAGYVPYVLDPAAGNAMLLQKVLA